MVDEDLELKDSEVTTQELAAIGLLSGRLKSIAGITGAVLAIGGIGSWVGVLTYKVDKIDENVEKISKSMGALPNKFEEIDKQERERFEQLRDATLEQFDNDNNELWSIKNAISQIRIEMRYRHGERAREISVETSMHATPVGLFPGMPPGLPPGMDVNLKTVGSSPTTPTKGRPTKAEVKTAAKTADIALMDMVESEMEEGADPLERLTF